ncbi:MAG TPA: FixH family protein [Myxococcota bacterium]|nr:FixH family protein [Myxococcota bacterium]
MHAKPWYREPWPWYLMAGPAVVVVAGIATTVLAVRSSDGLVADDYYKQGLGINRVIARDAQARALGISASLQFDGRRSRARVVLGPGPQPQKLRLALVHPTPAGADRSALLAATGGSVFEGPVQAPAAGRWHVHLEDGEGTWRLSGDWQASEPGVKLVPR